tara:strand:+ start:305 stop:1918 length:1614 start_codon:yes stop_codon:yes gene_type:complete
MKDLIFILGKKIKILLLLTLPLGVLVGFIEILFAISLNDLLISAKLIDGETRINFLNPIFLIFIIGIARFVIVFLSQVNTNYIFELVNKQIREITIENNYSYDKEIGILQSQKLLNVVSTKVAEFLHSCSNLSIQFIIFAIIYIHLLKESFLLTILTSFIFIFLALPMLIVKKKIPLFSDSFQKNLSLVIEKIFKDVRNLNFLRIIGSLNREKKYILKKNNSTLDPYKKYLISISFINQMPQLIGIIIISMIIIFNKKYLFLDKAALVPFLYLMLRSIISFGNIINDYGRILFTLPFTKTLVNIVSNNKKINYTNLNNNNLKKINCYNLEVNNLSIGYDKIVKSNLSFNTKEGSFVLFSGHSGAGKTALLMTIIGILKKKEGKILWDNTDIEKIDIMEFRKNISYCGTDPFLIEGSILENINYGSIKDSVNINKIYNALKICNCDFLKNENGYNLDFHLDNEGSGLSSGQRQRLSIARAIYKEPKILIIDEATVNIDEKNEYEILKNIKENFKECSIFAISHRKSLKQFSDQIIEIK